MRVSKYRDAVRPNAHGVSDARVEPTTALHYIVAVVAYVSLEWLSFLHEHNDLPVTPWNPGLGVMFALIVVRGPAMGLALFAGVLLAQVLVVRSELSWGVLLIMSAAIAGSYTLVATVAGRKLDFAPQLLRTRDIVVLVAAGLAGALLEAVQLWVLLLTTRHFSFADFGTTSVPLIVGDVIGIAVITPLMLRAHAHWGRFTVLSRTHSAEFALMVLAISLVLLVVVQPPQVTGHSLFYLLFLPVVIAAVRHGIDGACLALAVSQLGLVAILNWHGFDLSRFTEYQALMLVLTLTGLIVGGLVSERQAAHFEAEVAGQQLQQLEAQAARTARLNLASGMTAALSHEINQPMTAARALARSVQELMRAPSPDQERIDRNLASMVEQIDHAAAVVTRMREFLRRGAPRMSSLDMRFVIKEAVALLEPLLRSRQVQLHLDIPAQLPVSYGDRIQIGQVIINLIKNSIDAFPPNAQGEIGVSARTIEDGRAIEIGVRDNGPGIPSELVATLFEPLSTSRPDGIGLGLSICRTIVQAHGGRIWLHADTAQGTEFRFSIPAAEATS